MPAANLWLLTQQLGGAVAKALTSVASLVIPSAGATKFRWAVRARVLSYGGGTFWVDVRYPKSPSAALTKAELCEYLAGMPGKTVTVNPGSASAYSLVLGAQPYVRVIAWTEDMSSVLGQSEGNLPGVLAGYNCAD